MKKRLSRILVLVALTVLPLWAAEVWFSSAPASVNNGEGYYVEASAYTDGWGYLDLYKNGGYFIGSNGQYNFSAGATTSDSGPQTIEYHASVFDSYWSEYADDWFYLSVNPPANNSPFGVCDYSYASVPQNGTLYGNGWAVDNEMGAPISRVDILIDGSDVGDASLGDDRPDVADAFGRPDYRYSGWHFYLNIGGLSAGTHSLEFRGWDNQGASSSFGYRTFQVTNASPDIVLLSPSAQTINVGTTLTISSHATDPDGNITNHNLDIQKPDGTWNWYGGFAYGEPYMGGPVGSAADSTRTASFTFDIPGTWYVRSWVNDANSNSLHSATVAINVINPNHAPTISWATQPPAFPNSGTTFTARATGNDQDGNLSQVQVEQSVNGGAWTPFAYNGGGNGSTNTTDGNLVTAGAEGTTYQYRAKAYDSAGADSGNYIISSIASVNRTPSVTLQILDASKNAFSIGGNGRAQVFINTTYYVRISGSDPDGRLATLYERHIPVGGTEVDNQVSASGSSAFYDFGPFNTGATAGLIDTWGHAVDADAGGYVTSGQGWQYVGGPDIDVNKLNQAAVTITSAGTTTYGTAYTATASGGNGTGALSWTLGTGSTAAGAAINASSGVITANSAGTVVIKVRRLGDATYADSAWTADFTLTINKATLTVTANNAARTYGAANPTFTASYSGFVNGETAAVLTGAPSVTSAATATSPVGSYPITAAVGTLSATNYQFSFVNGTLNITKATLTVTANNANRTYGAANPTFSPSYSGFMNGETAAVLTGAPSLTTTATVTSSVGNYTITAALGTLAATNYQFSFVNGTLSITKATLIVTANSTSRTYGAANPTFSPNYSGFMNGETAAVLTGAPSLTTTATPTTPVGNYVITAAVGTLTATNYQFTFVDGTLTITKATLTVTANNANRTYGAANPAFSANYSGFVNGETTAVLSGAPSLTTTATTGSPVGSYTITAAVGTLAATNYQFIFVNGTLTINKATLTVTANSTSKPFGAANPAFTASYSGFVNGDTTAVLSGSPSLTTTATTGSPVGSYVITAAVGTLTATNYQFTFVNGTLTINKATLTVTANSASKVYGAANPVFTASYSGFVNGDTTAVLSGAPSLTTTATTGSAVGSYTITAAVGTLAATNYQFIFVNGTLTITKVTLLVVADNKSKSYGAANPPLTASWGGFVNGDTPAVLTGAPSLTTTATTGSPVGSYPIIVTAGTLAATNYQFNFVNGTLTINKATLTVTANNATLAYGATAAFSAAFSGFMNGDTPAVLSGAPAFTPTGVINLTPGVYSITPSVGTLAATNYQFAFVNGALTVAKATPLAVFANRSRVLNSAVYTVLAGDLDATFSNPDNPGSVSAPTGAIAYSLVGPGTPVSVGTALAGGATRTINAFYPGDANYQSATVNSDWQLTYVDSDTDGLPDYWEQQYLGTLGYAGNADPFEIGRTLTQSYAQSLSPLPAAVIPAGLRVWYRADLGLTTSGTGGLSQWLDVSGSGFHLLQATTAQQPLPVPFAINGQPVVDFGSSERMKTAAANIQAGTSDLTVIVVLKPAVSQVASASVVDFDSDGQQGFGFRQNGSTANQYMLRWRNQAQTAWEGQGAPVVNAAAGQSQLVTFVKSGTTQNAYLDGVSQASATVASSMFTPTAALGLGGSVTTSGDYFTGQIAEVLVYNRALNPTERGQVENELGAIYGLAGFDPYFDFDGNGLPDAWERKYFGRIGISPSGDADGDGVSNLLEYQLGRNPRKGVVPDTNGAVNLRVYTPTH